MLNEYNIQSGCLVIASSTENVQARTVKTRRSTMKLMLDGQRLRVDIFARARTSYNGLLQERLGNVMISAESSVTSPR